MSAPPQSPEFDPVRAAELAAFVAAAYAMYASDPASLEPAPVGIPPTHELVARVTMSDFLFACEEPAFYGIVARERSDPASHVIAIRGSADALELFDDLDVFSTPFTGDPNAGRVARGFSRIYRTLAVVPVRGGATPGAVDPRAAFSEQIAAATSGRASVAVTGHSLGAALATMYALENAAGAKVPMPLACTFGSPRVGNAEFVAAYDALDLVSWRVANVCDLVPDLPPDVFGYRHVATPELVDSVPRVRNTAACAHALQTYRALLDPRVAPSADCAAPAADADAGIGAP